MKRHGSPDPALVSRVTAAVYARDGKDERREVRFTCPAHDDEHPSARWNPASAVWHCDACQAGGGCVGLAKALGVELHTRNGHAPATPPRSETLAEYRREMKRTKSSSVTTGGTSGFPFYPRIAKSIGWQLVERHGTKWLKIETHDADGKPSRTKLRGPRIDGKLRCSFVVGPGVEGLANFSALAELRRESDRPPLVVLASGETDLLALEYARRAEGIGCAVVCGTKGEATALGELARAFAGCVVVVVADNDEVGRREAPRRAAEVEAAGARSVRVVLPPAPAKDARDHIQSGGTLRELLDAADTTTPRVWTLAELETAKLPQPEAFVADDLIVRGRVALIVSAPKVGKSIGCLHLAKCVAAGATPGTTWLGSAFTDNRAPVLYLCAEGGPYAAQERSRLVPPHGAIPDVHLVLDRPFPQLDKPEGLRILSRLVKRTGAGLVIVDPIARFRDLADENDNAEAQRFADGMIAFAEEHGVAVVLVHHPGRASMSEGSSGSFGGGRGASALFAAVDAEIALRKDSKTGEVHATFEKRYGRPIDPGRRLQRDPKTLILEHVGDLGGTKGRLGPDGVTPARSRYSIEDFKAALQPVGSVHTRDDVLAKLDCSLPTLKAHLERWTPALGADLDVGFEDGPKRRITFRLVPPDKPSGKRPAKNFRYRGGGSS